MQQLKKRQFTQKIETLGKSFQENHLIITQAKKELSTLCDTELRDKLRELKVYEILNAEKANPHFLELAKKSTTINENLSDISDTEGNVLATPEKLNEYITNFYSSLFRTHVAVQGEMTTFWGRTSGNTLWSVVVF